MANYVFIPNSSTNRKESIDGEWHIFFNDWKEFKNNCKFFDTLSLEKINDIYPFFPSTYHFFDFLKRNKIKLYIEDADKPYFAFLEKDLGKNYFAFLDALAAALLYLNMHPRKTFAQQLEEKQASDNGKRKIPIGRPPKTKELERAYKLVTAWEKAGEKPNIKMACEMAGVTRQAYYNYIKANGLD